MNKIDEKNGLKKEMLAVCEGLKSIKGFTSKNLLGMDYLSICALALEVIEQILGEDCDFPVDIETLVKKVGVDIIYQPLNTTWREEEKRVHKMVGTIFRRPGIMDEQIACILIDSQSKQEEQRYALAHELAHCLIHYEDYMFSSAYHLMPMLFKDMEEMVADIFAIFLLIPIPAFFRLFYEYINVQNEPVRTSEWLKYLSIIANVSYEEVSIGYQNIRYVSGIIYRLRHEEISLSELGDKVAEIASPEIKGIVIKQFERIMKNMSGEMEELLYV